MKIVSMIIGLVLSGGIALGLVPYECFEQEENVGDKVYSSYHSYVHREKETGKRWFIKARRGEVLQEYVGGKFFEWLLGNDLFVGQTELVERMVDGRTKVYSGSVEIEGFETVYEHARLKALFGFLVKPDLYDEFVNLSDDFFAENYREFERRMNELAQRPEFYQAMLSFLILGDSDATPLNIGIVPAGESMLLAKIDHGSSLYYKQSIDRIDISHIVRLKNQLLCLTGFKWEPLLEAIDRMLKMDWEEGMRVYKEAFIYAYRVLNEKDQLARDESMRFIMGSGGESMGPYVAIWATKASIMQRVESLKALRDLVRFEIAVKNGESEVVDRLIEKGIFIEEKSYDITVPLFDSEEEFVEAFKRRRRMDSEKEFLEFLGGLFDFRNRPRTLLSLI